MAAWTRGHTALPAVIFGNRCEHGLGADEGSALGPSGWLGKDRGGATMATGGGREKAMAAVLHGSVAAKRRWEMVEDAREHRMTRDKKLRAHLEREIG